MFKYYFKIFLRNIKRDKSSFFINLIGLSIGLTCGLLIFFWIRSEFNVDRFGEKSNLIYQILTKVENENDIKVYNETPFLLAESLSEVFPEFKYIGNSPNTSHESKVLSVGEQKIKSTGRYVSEDYFKIFSYKFVLGDRNTVKIDKNSIVISENLARRLYKSSKDVLGKTLMVNNKDIFTVSGVFKEPVNSSQKIEFFLSTKLVNRTLMGHDLNWINQQTNTYVLLNENAKLKEVNEKITNFYRKKHPGLANNSLFITLYAEKYLHGKYQNGEQIGGRIEYIRLFSIIGIFMIFVSCINFTNLSTTKATKRSKDVGINMTVGSGRKYLIFQYLSESIFMAFFSLFVSIMLIFICLPYFNTIAGKNINIIFDIKTIVFVLIGTLFTGILAGIYPAFYLTRFAPAQILKNKVNTSINEKLIKKGLLVFQFIISIGFIFFVIVVYKQIEFIQTENLGYDKNNIIYFEREGKLNNNLEHFFSDIKKIPGVLNTSSSLQPIVNHGSTTFIENWEGKEPDDELPFEIFYVNYDFIELFDIKIKEGRGFSHEHRSDIGLAILFNEAAIEAMNLENPVGKTVKMWRRDRHIIGVTENFHSKSFQEEIKPALFRCAPFDTRIIYAKINGKNMKSTLSNIKELYESYNPDFPFEYKFIDQDFEKLYREEKRVGLLSRIFCLITILISCLGLLGLASFTIQNRVKEIGIRKVFGASSFTIIKLFSSDFMRLIVISLIIGLPISYYLAIIWINKFVYKIHIDWWIFLGSGLIAILITLITVGSQAIIASNINPAISLKDE